MTFPLLVTIAAAVLIGVVFLQWLRGVARRCWVRGAGCPGCAYRNQGPCACDRKCINPACKGGGR